MTKYSRAPEIAEIATELIEFTPDHQDLVHARIEYVWRDTAAMSKGRITLACARKLSGLSAFLLQQQLGIADHESNRPLFVIEVAADTWRALDEKQRVALVDHELCHLSVTFDDGGNPVLGMRGHDVEEFSAVVRRHGLWKSDVALFAGEVAEQLTLAVDTAATFAGEDL